MKDKKKKVTIKGGAKSKAKKLSSYKGKKRGKMA